MRTDIKYDPSYPIRRLEIGDNAMIHVNHFLDSLVREKDKKKYGHIPNGDYIAKVIKPYYLQCEEHPELNGSYNIWYGEKHGCSDGIYADEN